MTYEGFLRIGGVEIVNTERARGYTLTNDCPERAVDADVCESLADALGDAPYVYSEINLAPWYDQSLDDLTRRFYGIVGLEVSGTSDSTRSAAQTQGVADGGVVGRTRKGMRSVRVRGTLLARGRDALDYGSQWLSSVFDGGCGQHGDACSMTDVEFLADCPPDRSTVPDYSAWTESRRNGVPRPLMAASTGWSALPGATITAVAGGLRVDSAAGGGPGAVFYQALAEPTPLVAGEEWTAGINVEVPVGYPALTARVDFVSLADGLTLASGTNITVAPGTSARMTAPNVLAVVNGSAGGVLMMRGTLVAGQRFIVSEPITHEGATVGTYFNGNTADVLDGFGQPVRQFSWAGAVGNSQSIEEIRIRGERPRTDEEYAAMVDPLRRFIHDISVTSGPIDVADLDFGQGFYGKSVEFTITSERAWIYSLTKQLVLAPALPTVVQDTPYNLVPYPSAELGAGAVVTATNFSANPSLEVNATGWAAYADAVNITAGMLGSGRVVNELSASGIASFRVVFTATGAGANGAFGAEQEVNLTTRPAGSRVSFNYWSAEVLMAGVPVRVPIDIVAYWRSASGGATLRTDVLGTVPVDGGSVSVKSVVPPVGANFVLVRAIARLTSWPAGTIVRLYADALAVTVP